MEFHFGVPVTSRGRLVLLEFRPAFCLGRVETVVNRVSRVFKENRSFKRERSSIAAGRIC